MFDNQLTGTIGKGQAPNNLPMGEPEDMFSAVGADDAGALSEPPSALEAGVLKPKASASSVAKESDHSDATPLDSADFEVMTKVPREQVRRVVPPANAPASYPEYHIQEPSIVKSIFLVVLVVLVVAGIGFGGWWAYGTYVASRLANSNDVIEPAVDDGTSVSSPEVTQSPQPIDDVDSDSNPIDDAILFGSVPDTDGDGLDDLKEKELGTDPTRFDTDGDGLSDYDEVVSWKSNPLNPDTDGDGYTDEQEIKNGYSPTGPGRIFEPPTSATVSQ